jgi:hypothetical protein
MLKRKTGAAQPPIMLPAQEQGEPPLAPKHQNTKKNHNDEDDPEQAAEAGLMNNTSFSTDEHQHKELQEVSVARSPQSRPQQQQATTKATSTTANLKASSRGSSSTHNLRFLYAIIVLAGAGLSSILLGYGIRNARKDVSQHFRVDGAYAAG